MRDKNSRLDRWISEFDHTVVASLSGSGHSERPYPAANQPECRFSQQQRRQVQGFMRVNHAGEVSAQALYMGQAMTARDEEVREKMQQSAAEELDHLHWCRQRLEELNGQTSMLDPFWFIGSFAIGSFAGLVGDKWSLGFIEETEKQVIDHLQSHIEALPEYDQRTMAILQQMQSDEAHHRDKAAASGSASLPSPVRGLMNLVSKVMTFTAYRI